MGAETESVERTAEKNRKLGANFQPSAARTAYPSAVYPSSKLLGYYHSSALRTNNSIMVSNANPREPSLTVGLLPRRRERVISGGLMVNAGSAEPRSQKNFLKSIPL